MAKGKRATYMALELVIMATILPPPSKRQKLETLERSKEQQVVGNESSGAGSLRLQFIDESTGQPIFKGPVVVAVKDATPKNLELLVKRCSPGYSM